MNPLDDDAMRDPKQNSRFWNSKMGWLLKWVLAVGVTSAAVWLINGSDVIPPLGNLLSSTKTSFAIATLLPLSWITVWRMGLTQRIIEWITHSPKSKPSFRVYFLRWLLILLGCVCFDVILLLIGRFAAGILSPLGLSYVSSAVIGIAFGLLGLAIAFTPLFFALKKLLPPMPSVRMALPNLWQIASTWAVLVIAWVIANAIVIWLIRFVANTPFPRDVLTSFRTISNIFLVFLAGLETIHFVQSPTVGKISTWLSYPILGTRIRRITLGSLRWLTLWFGLTFVVLLTADILYRLRSGISFPFRDFLPQNIVDIVSISGLVIALSPLGYRVMRWLEIQLASRFAWGSRWRYRPQRVRRAILPVGLSLITIFLLVTYLAATRVNQLVPSWQKGIEYVRSVYPIQSAFGEYPVKSIQPTSKLPPQSIVQLLESNDSIFALNAEGTILRSDDDGLTWREFTQFMPKGTVMALIGQQFSVVSKDSEFCDISTSSGKWRNCTVAFTQTVNAIAGYGADIVIGTPIGVFYSPSGDDGWYLSQDLQNVAVKSVALAYLPVTRPTNSAGITNTPPILSFDDPSFLVGTDNGLYQSKNRGKTWQTVKSNLNDLRIDELLWLPKPQILLVRSRGSLYWSSDGGQVWQLSNLPQDETAVHISNNGINPLVFAVTNKKIWISHDSGHTWTIFRDSLPMQQITSLLWHAKSNSLFVGTEQGMYRVQGDEQDNEWRIADWYERPLSQGYFIDSLFCATNTGHIYARAASANGSTLYQSKDGVSWHRIFDGRVTVNTALWNDEIQSIRVVRDDGIYHLKEIGFEWDESRVSTFPDNQFISDSLPIAHDEYRKRWFVAHNVPNVPAVNNNPYLYGILNIFNETWNIETATSLPKSIYSMALDDLSGTLYVGTQGGIYLIKQKDQLLNVEERKIGIDGDSDKMIVQALWADSRSSKLWAGTTTGLLVSQDEGQTWQHAGASMLSGVSIFSLYQSDTDNRLFAGTNQGLFYSNDGGTSWATSGNDLNSTIPIGIAINHLLYCTVPTSTSNDTNSKPSAVLYAGTDNGVFRSDDDGTSWRPINLGMSNKSIGGESVTWDRDTSTLIVYESSKVFESMDLGKTWSWKEKNKKSDTQESKASDESNLVSALLSDGILLRDQQGELQGYVQTPNTPNDAALRQIGTALLPEGLWNLIRLTGEEPPTFASWNGSSIHIYHLKPDLIAPIWQIYVRLAVWGLPKSIQANTTWIVFSALLTIVVILIRRYLIFTRPFGAPLQAILLPGGIATLSKPERLKEVWPLWLQAIRTELLRFGDVIPADLRPVPAPFRRYALQRYADEFRAKQTIRDEPGHIRLLTDDVLHRWQSLWRITAQRMGTQPGLDAQTWKTADALIHIINTRLQFKPPAAPHAGNPAVRGYLLHAPNLRVNVPAQFPLIFVADPKPSDQTVLDILDWVKQIAVDVEKPKFALIVPLEPVRPDVDIGLELRRAIQRSPYANDFIVLSGDDIVDLLIARDPEASLIKLIAAQADLTSLSPFISNGPVADKIFVGREHERKLLKERLTTADFSIPGNRIMGKTSLLLRTIAELKDDERVLPLYLDCQECPDLPSFLHLFAHVSGIPLVSPSVAWLREAVRSLSNQGRLPVLFMDEVDVLLTHDHTGGAPLIACLRAMAFERLCHVVLAGAGDFARLKSDPASPLFNFGQQILIGYLSKSEVAEVLIRPLKNLGIEIEDDEKFLDRVFALTSGHPSLTQKVGDMLVREINRRKERQIHSDDIDRLAKDFNFADTYLEFVLGIIYKDSFEKLVVLAAPGDEFELADLEQALQQHDISFTDARLDTALDLLRVYSILEKVGRTQYRFVPRYLKTLLRETQSVERLIRKTKHMLSQPT